MLNFRNTNIFFISLLAILIGVHVKYGLPVFAYFILLIAYSLILFWGCYYVGSNFFIKIVCKAETDKKEIAISFDDGNFFSLSISAANNREKKTGIYTNAAPKNNKRPDDK